MKWVIAAALLIAGLVALLVFWTPAPVLQWVMNRGLATLNQRLDAEIRVGHVSGRLWGTLDFDDVTITRVGTWRPDLHLDSLSFRIGWRALRHQRMDVQNITIDRASIRLGATRPGTSDLLLSPIDAQASLQGKTLSIASLSIGVGQGNWKGLGTVDWQDTLRVDLIGKSQQFPLDSVLRWQMKASRSLALPHTGAWTIHWDDKHSRVTSKGMVTGDLAVRIQTLYEEDLGIAMLNLKADAQKNQVRVEAKIDVPSQRILSGRFDVTLSSIQAIAHSIPGLPLISDITGMLTTTGTVQGPWIAPGWAVTGHVHNLAMRGRTLRAGTWTATGIGAQETTGLVHLEDADWNPTHSSWTLRAANFEWKRTGTKRLVEATVTTIRDARMDFRGTLEELSPGWRVTWENLTFAPDEKTLWRATTVDGLTYHPADSIPSGTVTLTDGKNSLLLTARELGSEGWRLHAQSSQLPLKTLTTFWPEIGFDKDDEANIEATMTRGRSGPVSTQASARAKKITMTWKDQLKARGDAELTLTGDGTALLVGGRVMMDEITYTVPKKRMSWFTPKPAAPASTNFSQDESLWTTLRMAVQLEWPRRGWFRDGLTKIETSGDLWVRKKSGEEEVRLTGTIQSLRGTYSAHGRDFIIQEGGLQFPGTPGFNPNLNILAQYKTQGIDVRLLASGPLETPTLEMTSSPPMPESDIAYVLVFGSLPPSRNREATGATPGQEARDMAANAVTGALTSELRESGLDMGLDVVRFDTTATGSRLVMGRYIGSRLFASYGQPTQSQASRLFAADYSLTDHWSVKGQYGDPDESHVNLQYRVPLNKPKPE